jgi:hypothetical protein
VEITLRLSRAKEEKIMSETKALWAPVKWAQRKEALYVTVDLPDVKDEKVSLNNKNLTFKYVPQEEILPCHFVSQSGKNAAIN